MKRDPSLVPLSHDHHHALVAARRLRAAADDPDAAAEVEAFSRFFAAESVRHFREEEERVFPLVAEAKEAGPLIVRALLEHQQLHSLAGRVRDTDPALMRELADRLEAHVRFEERELFPLLERLLGDSLQGVDLAGEREPALQGRGPVWGAESEDLNATLLVWSATEGPPEHVNDERDVLLFVVDGAVMISIDGSGQELRAGEALIVAKGRRRSIIAGPGGARYLSVHLRRPPLQVRPRA